MAVHDIVIVGGAFAGLSTAHYLLRHTIPKLEASSSDQSYKVTIISTTDRFFFKIASPRTVASPDLLPASKALLPIADGFKSYPKEKFELVVGTATGLEEDNKTVVVTTSGGKQGVHYDSLIIASGSRTNSPLWTLHDTYQETEDELKRINAKLPTAGTILVAGGGPAGVETAGEIAYTFPNASMTILSGTSRLLSKLRPAVGAQAEAHLAKMKVTTKHQVRVSSTESKGEQTVVKLSDGTSMPVDVYIDATGPVPNSNWLPKAWLDEKNRVKTDINTLRGPASNVYAVGDVASYSKMVIFDATDVVRPLCSSILEDLSPDPKPKHTPYKQLQKEMQVVPVGKKAGVGVVMGWKVPSWFVWMVKGRTYFIDKAAGAVHGAEFVKA